MTAISLWKYLINGDFVFPLFGVFCHKSKLKNESHFLLGLNVVLILFTSFPVSVFTVFTIQYLEYLQYLLKYQSCFSFHQPRQLLINKLTKKITSRNFIFKTLTICYFKQLLLFTL